jgi:hypothetical protein
LKVRKYAGMISSTLHLTSLEEAGLQLEPAGGSCSLNTFIFNKLLKGALALARGLLKVVLPGSIRYIYLKDLACFGNEGILFTLFLEAQRSR